MRDATVSLQRELLPHEIFAGEASQRPPSKILLSFRLTTASCSAHWTAGQTWTGNQPIPYMQTTVINGPFTAGSTTIDLASTRGYSNGVQFTLYLDDGSPIYLTQSGAPSGSTITFTPAFPPGTSASAGNALYSNNIGSGYGFASYGNLQQLAADHVAANTFYAVNINSGLYRWTNCDALSLINANTGGWLCQRHLEHPDKDCSG